MLLKKTLRILLPILLFVICVLIGYLVQFRFNSVGRTLRSYYGENLMITWNGEYFYKWTTVSERTGITPLRVTNPDTDSEWNNNMIAEYEDSYLTLQNYFINEKEVTVTYNINNETERALSYSPGIRLEYYSNNKWYWLNADFIYPSTAIGLRANSAESLTQNFKNIGDYSEVTDKPLENEKAKAKYRIIIVVIEDPYDTNSYRQIALELFVY